MTTLTLPVYKDGDNNDWLHGYDVFVIEMTAAMATSYLSIMDMVRESAAMLKASGAGDLYEFRIWDYNGVWLPGDYDVEPLLLSEFLECPPPLAGAEPSRTECEILQIGATDLQWTAIAKHADVRVSTALVSRERLMKIANQEVESHG